MIFVTGGAFQGKRTFVCEKFGIKESEIVDAGTCDISAVNGSVCVCRYELAVKRLIAEGEDPVKFTETLDCGIVIMNDIGCGIIPAEKSEREWRELAGRAGCIIAARADTVYRVCCGIAQIIAGKEKV